MKRGVIVLFGAVCLYCCTTHAQIESGTVIVLQLTKNGFVIAADSRATFRDKPPEDTHCKIAALDRQFVVGVDGAAFYTPGEAEAFHSSWNAIEEAKRIAGTYGTGLADGPEATVKAIANRWAASLQSNWTKLYAAYPDRVITAATIGKGVLTNGLFAFAQNQRIAFTIRSVISDGHKIRTSTPQLPDCITQPCASGKIDIPMEFIRLTSKRAREEKKHFTVSPSVLANASFEVARAVRLVELTIKYDTSHEVGGPVDGLELLNNGTVSWFRRKDNCPAGEKTP